MTNLIGGLILTLIGVMLIAVLNPVVSPMIDGNRGSDVYNCVGYVSTSGANTSYNSSLSGNTNTSGCTIVPFTVPGIGAAFIVVGIMTMMYGGGAVPKEF